ncbi:hypothetical protein TNCT_328801 [Trichonephila clavata]|uniref:Uncharacterized protein n=1 Tax=Trichonephila clavata TaxID=2740835 RepID=A0A8X6G7P9_TRICU|nr:hypothetical protein TNCT_328801 [Trichonephila clavata]
MLRPNRETANITSQWPAKVRSFPDFGVWPASSRNGMGRSAKVRKKKVMSKFWVFVYRNANDNHIIAAAEEFSDESAQAPKIVLRNKGQGGTVALGGL